MTLSPPATLVCKLSISIWSNFIAQNLISGTEALRQATNPGQLSMALRGITALGPGRAGSS